MLKPEPALILTQRRKFDFQFLSAWISQASFASAAGLQRLGLDQAAILAREDAAAAEDARLAAQATRQNAEQTELERARDALLCS